MSGPAGTPGSMGASTLGLYANRITASVVGRGLELAAADREN